ncbi:MAG: prolipoprotein diacylglyceryl transferase [Eubacterium sp.]|nr:prolipoprotein diacylglyceryl transferase [Eubacterium sp.]
MATAIEFPNLHIKINSLPKSFSVFGFEISFYGVIIAIGMLLGILLVLYEAKKTDQDYNTYIDLAIFAIIVGVVCARLYYVIFRWSYYSKNFGEIINVRGGGLAIYGGVIGAVVTAIILCKVKKLSFGKVADTAILGLLVGQIIGRWGNFFNREAFGGVTGNGNLFAMRLHFDKVFNISQVPESVIKGMPKISTKSIIDLKYVQVHPTFLYESLWNLLVLVLILIFRRKKAFQGEVFIWYLGGYGLGRFFIEGLRSDQLLLPWGWPVSQVLSALLVVGAIVAEIVIRRRIKNELI